MKSIKELLEFSIINLDKPAGPTSFEVSDLVRKMLSLRKTSHLGTLDPAVSGVLPIALNRACKLSGYLMKKDKSYVGIMRLHEDVDTGMLKKVMKDFTGKISQMPPVRSSVKRALREREVMKFDFIERHDKDVLFSADVEAGTYIRTLVKDLGEKIGGAHMLELRRTRAGTFDERDCFSLYQLEQAVKEWKNGREELLRQMLIPADEVIVKIMKKVLIKENNLKSMFTGKPIHAKDLVKKIEINQGEKIAVFFKERFVEVARVVNQGDIFAMPEFVLN